MVVPPQSKPAPNRRARRGAFFGRFVLVLILLGAVAGGAYGIAMLGRTPRAEPEPPFQVPFQELEPGSAVPNAAGEPTAAPGASPSDSRSASPSRSSSASSSPSASTARGGDTSAAVAAWAAELSKKIEVPARALRAYGEAELLLREELPRCGITWATLAGIGRIESHHGTIGGLELGEDGRPNEPIIGIPLDGSPGVKAIEDTDGGKLDGDTRWDRAVGPMQFIPTTWARYGMRANGDGKDPDPQDIDDAALTAGRYLCVSGGDMTSGAGWWRGVMTYNESVEYARNVFSGADAYARASVGAPAPTGKLTG
ncbi:MULTISPECIES: lytic transglycosylase domain-containing protein [Actinosynnema]|uniref:Lytic murein transglycosylase n=1 Tax=Actinosynnema pretiosum TaxID=42197 RepID=A0A290Z069_9PSEU|nr:lytic murein transglycosylase [Actinosynnema pretiosum]ATE52436.1 lytic murein transglycosylase [Actinosynnema pretiosum]